MAEYEDQCDDTNAICPYCKEKHRPEAEDYNEDPQEIECYGCGKRYWLAQSFSVTHHTDPDCELNGEEHQYEQITLRSGKTADFCAICYKCRIIEA